MTSLQQKQLEVAQYTPKTVEELLGKVREEERERLAVKVWGLWGQKPDHMEDTERSRTFSEIINFIRANT